MSKRSEIVLSKEAACIPEKKRKTALAIVKDRQRSAAGWTAGSHSTLIVPTKLANGCSVPLAVESLTAQMSLSAIAAVAVKRVDRYGVRNR